MNKPRAIIIVSVVMAAAAITWVTVVNQRTSLNASPSIATSTVNESREQISFEYDRSTLIGSLIASNCRLLDVLNTMGGKMGFLVEVDPQLYQQTNQRIEFSRQHLNIDRLLSELLPNTPYRILKREATDRSLRTYLCVGANACPPRPYTDSPSQPVLKPSESPSTPIVRGIANSPSEVGSTVLDMQVLKSSLATANEPERISILHQLNPSGAELEAIHDALLYDPSPIVRQAAALELEPSDDATTIDVLLRAIHDSDEQVVVAALRALNSLVTDEQFRASIAHQLSHTQSTVIKLELRNFLAAPAIGPKNRG